MRDVADYAREAGLRVHLHLSETRKEHEECKTRHNGLTPAALFERVGLFDVPTIAAHCVWIEGEDFDILRDKGVTVAHNPSSNMKLGSGFAPVKKMLEAASGWASAPTAPPATTTSICWRKSPWLR